MLRKIFYTGRQCSRDVHKSQKIQWLSTKPRNVRMSTATDSASDYLLEQEHIDEAIKVQPILASTSPDLWRRIHEVFVNHGLYTPSFLRIVTGNPTILSRSPQKIVESLEYWRSCQFGEQQMHLLVTKYPELLNVNDCHRLLVHISYLKSFAGTQKNVWKLLMNCPDLLEQSELRIEEKIVYLKQVMRLEVPEIVKSEALSKTLADIRCRHVFLQRLGLFKPRSPKEQPDQPTKNHRLYQITDTSDKKFATKLCRISLLEYETFKELYARELERKGDAVDEGSDDE